MNNFEGIKFFSPTSQNWGDSSLMNRELLLRLDDFADKVDSKIIVTSAYRPQSDGSQHQTGKAADVMAPEFIGSLLDLYHIAEACGFQGIGIYPDWRLNGVRRGGLHLDVRESKGPHAKWMGVNVAPNKQIYVALNAENLKKYGLAVNS